MGLTVAGPPAPLCSLAPRFAFHAQEGSLDLHSDHLLPRVSNFPETSEITSWHCGMTVKGVSSKSGYLGSNPDSFSSYVNFGKLTAP